MPPPDDDIPQRPSAESVPGIARPPAQERGCLDLVSELRAADRAICALLAEDRRDTHDIPGFAELWDALAGLVAELCATPAVGLEEIGAKGEAALHFAKRDGDRGARIALSLARDIVALARMGRAVP